MEKEIIVDEKKYMTAEELATVNINVEKYKNFEHRKRIVDMQMQVLQVREALHKAQLALVEKDKTILKLTAAQNTTEFSDFKESNKKLMRSIASANGLSDDQGFGYDPESGELIINTDNSILSTEVTDG